MGNLHLIKRMSIKLTWNIFNLRKLPSNQGPRLLPNLVTIATHFKALVEIMIVVVSSLKIILILRREVLLEKNFKLRGLEKVLAFQNLNKFRSRFRLKLAKFNQVRLITYRVDFIKTNVGALHLKIIITCNKN